MKIGVFDSGLGGLAIARAIAERLPEYDYLYLGDTKRVPYGNRSQETIHEFTAEALDFLFENGCRLVVIACNTASAESLRKSQQEYLPKHYPERRVLGVIIPTAEAAVEAGGRNVGVMATVSTVESGAYERELKRCCETVNVIQRPAPLLVPIIENDGLKYVGPILDDYLAGLENVDSLILGCTHYCLVKDEVRKRFEGPVISSDEVVPAKLEDYLKRHPEMERELAKKGKRRYCVTDLTSGYASFAHRLMGENLPLEVVSL
jgi:glutamate racemase